MKSYVIKLALAGLALSASLTGCASKLPRDVKDNTPDSVAEPLDFELVEFADLRTGETINLKSYMDEQGRDFLLLTFGAQFCSACSDKGRHLVADVIGKHPLYLTDVAKRFEIVGINTDQYPDRLGSYLTNFPFMQWSDPAPTPADPEMAMLRFFMPAGNKFKVPLTVMVSRRGIEWRIMPDEQIAMAEMMERVEFTLGLTGGGPDDGGDAGDAGDADDGDGDGDDGDGDGGDGGESSPLGIPGPGRLKSVDVVTCAGATKTLHDVLGAAKYRFVQVTKGACDATCQANALKLKNLPAACQTRGSTCAVASLTSATPARAECDSGLAAKGGEAFFDVFKTHFNWDDPRVLDPDTALARFEHELTGPLVLGFDGDGKLVYSKEGALSANDLASAMGAADFGAVARGPDFRLYDQATSEFGFADMRRKAAFTVVTAFGSMCSSCILELKHWSEPGQLVDFCAARPDDCQVRALETGELPAGQTLAQYHEGILNGTPGFDGFAALGIRASLVLDPLPKYLPPDFTDNLDRFFEGYLIANSPNPEWWGDPRTVIFDREGKVVAQFKSETPPAGEDDPVFKKLKALLGP